ncbi:hypothetical protein ACFFS2_03060 [Streptomyces aurantiacus]|uniref:Uncharacterized protein n=1 Tax=Streptomyces aurantiacus TaxID=47760 RepID=A0A7G1PAZ2_9ACTN|nr:hypothetical protein [Streptomyces aurantiacus]BCL30930.1 hypothetical protein GCM10017557_57890 [Streptomyces aurantiacus]
MTEKSELRLLPWAGSEGKPCYLSSSDADGFMSRLADRIEADQLDTASELLKYALQVLDHQPGNLDELPLLVAQLAGALEDVLRVATSRGSRLATPRTSEGEESV